MTSAFSAPVPGRVSGLVPALLPALLHALLHGRHIDHHCWSILLCSTVFHVRIVTM
jgi:hypothetical protein